MTAAPRQTAKTPAMPPPPQRPRRGAPLQEGMPGRAATVVVVGGAVQALPWESLPSMRAFRCSTADLLAVLHFNGIQGGISRGLAF